MWPNIDKTLQMTLDLMKFKGPLKNFQSSRGLKDQGFGEIEFTNRLTDRLQAIRTAQVS